MNFWRIAGFGVDTHPNLTLVEHDLTDAGSSLRLLERTQPDELYNLAAQSFVGVVRPAGDDRRSDGPGSAEPARGDPRRIPKTRFYQASTSEMFGKVQSIPQTEATSFYPRSPYGVAKLYAHWMTVNYRESYGLFGSSGILFNHESAARPRVRHAQDHRHHREDQARQGDPPRAGNLDAKRDWGFALEYVEGMWRMLQADEPDTYVLATNRTETVRDFVRMAFAAAGYQIEWTARASRSAASTRRPAMCSWK